MKKFALFLAPLMAITFLTNCGGTKQYTVTFNTGEGGSLVPSQKVEANKCATKPDDPAKTKEGYTCSFLYWELDNNEFNFNTPIDKDITLTAKWKEEANIYTVTFDVDGDKEKIEPQQVAYGNYATKPVSPTKETTDLIYEVDYWELNGSRFSFNTPITNDITLKAKWNKGGMIKASWEELAAAETPKYHIGDYKYLTVNGQPHKVRIIDTKHDEIVNEQGEKTGEKANYTFEFANLLSDKNGYSLATLWRTDYPESPAIANYFDSDLRKAVDGVGTGSLSWYTKGDDKVSTEYTTSTLDMLPNDLTSQLKMVQKNVRIYDGVEDQHFNSYNAKLFLLTHNEMNTNPISEGYEGTTYQFYKDNNTDSARIKHQVKWHDNAALTYTQINDKSEYGAEQNFAGFNNEKEENGGLYWSVSPNCTVCNESWRVDFDGSLEMHGYLIRRYAFAIAPAFCI